MVTHCNLCQYDLEWNYENLSCGKHLLQNNTQLTWTCRYHSDHWENEYKPKLWSCTHITNILLYASFETLAHFLLFLVRQLSVCHFEITWLCTYSNLQVYLSKLGPLSLQKCSISDSSRMSVQRTLIYQTFQSNTNHNVHCFSLICVLTRTATPV